MKNLIIILAVAFSLNFKPFFNMKRIRFINITAIVFLIMMAITSCKKENNIIEEKPAISEITVTPSTSDVPKGYALEFTATVTGDKLTEADQAVNWTVTGGAKQGTSITNAGTLTVAADETAETLTVTAISKTDNSKRGTTAVRVYKKQDFLFDCTKGSEIVEIEYLGEKILCNYIDGLYIIEGDIIIKYDDTLFDSISPKKTYPQHDVSLRAAVSTEIQLWDEGKVYYYFDPRQDKKLPAPILSNVESAIKIINNENNNIKFIKLSDIAMTYFEYVNKPYILISYDTSKNASEVGMVGSRQPLYLGSEAALHELGHAIGLVHEHSRYDRSNFVSILYQNIKEDEKHNFDVHGKLKIWSDFDFESIMMYNSYDFSKNDLPTITKTNGNTFYYPRNSLSVMDKEIIKKMYPNREVTPDIFIYDKTANLTSNSCELTGELIYGGYPANYLTEYGICYREKGSVSWEIQKAANNIDGVFSCLLGGLKSNKLYVAGVYYKFNGDIHYNLDPKIEFTTLADDGLTDDIHNIIPDDVLEKINDLGIVLNGGNHPPTIEGDYYVSPLILVKSNFADSYKPGYRFADMQLSFSKQDNAKLTVVCDYINGNQIANGLGAFVTGEGNKFSVFVEVSGTLSGYPFKSVEIYSGEISSSGIKNLQWVIIITQDAPSTIKRGQGRLIYDSDGLSNRITGMKSKIQSEGLLPSAIRSR